jgi:multimeric flavodoxin WrbA
VKDVKKLSAEDYDFLVLGSPTKFGTMSFAVRRFLGKVMARTG